MGPTIELVTSSTLTTGLCDPQDSCSPGASCSPDVADCGPDDPVQDDCGPDTMCGPDVASCQPEA